MDEKQVKAMNRLLKKLAALRATLKSDERELLDALIITPADEVEGHMLKPNKLDVGSKTPAPDEVEAHQMSVGRWDLSKTPAPDDVEAHQMKVGRWDLSKTPAPDDVEAHQMKVEKPWTGAKTPAPDEVEAHQLKVERPWTGAKTPAPDEVEAHQMEVGRWDLSKTPAPDEVEAHKLQSAKNPAPNVGKPQFAITFDAQKNTYKLI